MVDEESPRVLCVDDDVKILRSLQRTLTAHGLDVVCSSCTAEANAILKRVDIQVIVCDQQMPGQSGLDFLTEILQQKPDLIAFMLSGRVAGLVMAEQWANEIGVRRIFSKPCDANELAKAIISALAAKLC